MNFPENCSRLSGVRDVCGRLQLLHSKQRLHKSSRLPEYQNPTNLAGPAAGAQQCKVCNRPALLEVLYSLCRFDNFAKEVSDHYGVDPYNMLAKLKKLNLKHSHVSYGKKTSIA